MRPRSLVIDTLKTTLENNPEARIGVAYVYCNYRDQDQESHKLIATIVRQLLALLDIIPEGVISIYNKLRKQGNPVPLDDAMAMLLLVCAAFDRVYICVDALNELKDRDTFLKSLKSLRESISSIHLFTTGRNNTQDTV